MGGCAADGAVEWRKQPRNPEKPIEGHGEDEYEAKCRCVNCRLARMECMIGRISKNIEKLIAGKRG